MKQEENEQRELGEGWQFGGDSIIGGYSGNRIKLISHIGLKTKAGDN